MHYDKLDDLNNIRKYNFGYRSDTYKRTFTFTYDFTKDIYYEKVESSFINEEGNLKQHVQNLSFIMGFDMATYCNNTLNLSLRSKSINYSSSLKYLFKYIVKDIKVEDLNYILRLTKKIELHINRLHELEKENLEILYCDEKVKLQSEAKKGHCHLDPNYVLDYLDKEGYYTHILQLYLNSLNIKEIDIDFTIYLNKLKASDLDVLKDFIAYNSKARLVEKYKDIASIDYFNSDMYIDFMSLLLSNNYSSTNILNTLNLELMNYNEADCNPISFLLYFSNYIVDKLNDISLIQDNTNNSAIIELIYNNYLRSVSELDFINILTSYIIPVYDMHNELYENYIDRYDNKNMDLNNIKHYLDKEYCDVFRSIEENKVEKNILLNATIETVIKLTTKDILRDITDKLTKDIKITKHISKDIILVSNDIQAIKEFFKELNIENKLESLLEKSISNRECLNIMIEDIDKLLNSLDKSILFSSKHFLEKFEGIFNLIIEELKSLSKKTIESYTEKSALLKIDNNKSVTYEKDTLTFNEMKLINMEDEKQLKLWKRFWFLYASDEVDRKILPYNDFPYESEPIEFEGKDHLYPENWNVTHPHEFWKKVSYHPILEGTEEALDEIDLSVNIMIEIINVLILMWGKHYAAFWGWTGTQAVLGITGNVYEWLRLETSLVTQADKNVKEHYDRCFRWLRWESEKVSLMARNDMELRGNYYVGLLIEEMISYMVDHHFNVMPLFQDINKMDEWRQNFDRNLQDDIPFVLDKVKGIRHKIIEGKERKINA